MNDWDKALAELVNETIMSETSDFRRKPRKTTPSNDNASFFSNHDDEDNGGEYVYIHAK